MARTLVRTLWLLAALAAGHALPLGAQLVPIRTVPVASGDQFVMVPSVSLAMGGVRVAVDDSLGDPWVNPSKGVFVREAAFFSAPTFYGISGRGGAGRTFPVGGLFAGDAWFGGGMLALQQIDNDRQDDFFIRPFVIWDGPPRRLNELSSRNLFAAAFLGRRLGRGPWSVGFSAQAAHLDAMDGVDLLYANAERIEQSGTLSDLRLGLYRTGGRDRVALLLVHDRVSMTHDVTYVDIVCCQPTDAPVVRPRLEVNEDKTRTWGGHVEWDRDLQAPGWRIGASATFNHKSHPKIPNYEVQNIPRDPGTTWAYEGAFGLARTRGGTTFGLDVVLQPIWSDTWQEADRDTVTSTGAHIRLGEKTIENEFFFTNVVLRAGLEHRIEDFAFHAGLEARSYDYGLEQRDHLQNSFREQDESWMEWSPSVGVTFRFDDLELRYAGRLTTGTGRPGVAWDGEARAALNMAADFIVAPSGPLTLQDAHVVTHQVSVLLPIR